MLFGPEGRAGFVKVLSMKLHAMDGAGSGGVKLKWMAEAQACGGGHKAIIFGRGLCHGCGSDCHATQPQDMV